MMERFKPEHGALALAFAAMVFVPWLLLTAEPDVPQAQPILITQVSPQEIVLLATALEKPIFNAERAPLSFADEMLAGMGDEELPENAAAAPQNPVPTLVGLVSRRRGKAVAIVKSMDGKTETLRRGQSIDGWQLVSIGRAEVVFAGAGGQQTAKLDYGNKAIGGPANDETQTKPTANQIGENN